MELRVSERHQVTLLSLLTLHYTGVRHRCCQTILSLMVPIPRHVYSPWMFRPRRRCGMYEPRKRASFTDTPFHRPSFLSIRPRSWSFYPCLRTNALAREGIVVLGVLYIACSVRLLECIPSMRGL